MNSDLVCDFCLRNAAPNRSFTVGEDVARRCICHDCVLAFADEIKAAQLPTPTAKPN
jgi:hypothetical protein